MKKTLLMLALVAGITSLAQNATAALITIDIGSSGFNIGGINAGLANGLDRGVGKFPILGGGTLFLSNELQYNEAGGVLTGLEGMGLAFAAGATAATPVKFSLNASIGSGSTYRSGPESLFKYSPSVSPDFGAGSYMGFKTSQGNYGWLEVTWTASTSEFRILSGAYEDQINTPILAGAGGAAPIPEPGTWAAMAIFAGGAAYSGWRRRKSAKVSE